MYGPENFISIKALKKIDEGSFAPLGMFFIIEDILRGQNEGIINLKALASSLGITMTTMYKYIGILEDSFIIETTTTPEGRKIKIILIKETVNDDKKHIVSETAKEYVKESGENDEIVNNGAVSEVHINAPLVQNKSPQYYSAEFLINYLKSHGIIIRNIPEQENISSDAITSGIYLGDNFKELKNFYSKLKSTLNDCKSFEHHLTVYPNDTANRVMSFARNLHQQGFLTSYEYKKKPDRFITVQAAKTSEAHKFLSGYWLEHWVYSKVKSILPNSVILRNIQITLPEDEQTEIDLFGCAGEKIFWIESKTGKYSSYLDRYIKIARLLELPRENAILVTADASPVLCEGITCCDMENFPEVFKACT